VTTDTLVKMEAGTGEKACGRGWGLICHQ
jgi:hypothetical protein